MKILEEEMITLNKYLRELGINEDNFYFKKEDDRYIPNDDTGIPESHTWEMDGALAMIIYSYLMKYKEIDPPAYPAIYTEEKWRGIIDEMIKGFASIIKNETSKRARKRQRKALALFKNNFFNLWW